MSLFCGMILGPSVAALCDVLLRQSRKHLLSNVIYY